MARTHILGFPRIGAQRELKSALEAFWGADAGASALEDAGAELRQRHWQLQREAQLDVVSVGDFSFYDHMLDHAVMLGALPERFGFDGSNLTRAQYFALARGDAAQPPLEMTKWFDTNYHYLVPELGPDARFDGDAAILLNAIKEAVALGHRVKPVLVGPVTFLWLSKAEPGFDRLSLLPRVVAAYERVLHAIRSLGIEWVQIDEPALCTDLDAMWLDAYDRAYTTLGRSGVKILLATYFGNAAEYASRVVKLPVDGFHVDLVRAAAQREVWRALLPAGKVLSAGIIDGRNIWRTDLRRALGLLRPLHDELAERLWIAPSCSLLHVPVALGH